MSAALIFKVLAGLVGIAGVSTAAGVPLSMSASSNTKRGRGNITGGGVDQISIGNCEPIGAENRESVLFGSQNSVDICGQLKSGEQSLTGAKEYTDFFKDRGGSQDKNWNQRNNQDRGTQQCSDKQDSLKWAIFDSSSGSGIQHLGVCGESQLENTKFVKRVQNSQLSENRNEWNFGVCENNCGSLEIGTISGSTTSLTQEREGSGKEVQFYKKRKV